MHVLQTFYVSNKCCSFELSKDLGKKKSMMENKCYDVMRCINF